MKKPVPKYFILILLCLFFCFSKAWAQNPDIDFVRAVNPMGDKAFIFRGLSASVYPVSIAIPAGTFAYGAYKKDKCIKLRAYEGAGSVVIAGLAALTLKEITDRQRPYQKYNGVYPVKYESGNSFPSAHSTVAFATATTLALQYKRWYIVAPAYMVAASCGFSRIYLGEHYPSDVLAGAAIGTGSAFLSHWLTKKIFKPCSVLKEPM